MWMGILCGTLSICCPGSEAASKIENLLKNGVLTIRNRSEQMRHCKNGRCWRVATWRAVKHYTWDCRMKQFEKDRNESIRIQT
ncbi:hypothetical protein K469DRAFT_345758 [Zopfia rhizophila CBS 207.26]|uniref:Secreted protein n=1 Tax=Zopfia rhizophila CBS 207.26 TaxID=1314779 RepID=A0A6A6ELP2_9PEZI|nr:hypothetical protein K469DRAFT_345758 [Zopfia rhizophila CBS 207.26]